MGEEIRPDFGFDQCTQRGVPAFKKARDRPGSIERCPAPLHAATQFLLYLLCSGGRGGYYQHAQVWSLRQQSLHKGRNRQGLPHRSGMDPHPLPRALRSMPTIESQAVPDLAAITAVLSTAPEQAEQ